MRESAIYQEILQEGRQEGRQEGFQQGLQQGRQEEGTALLLRLLERRFGPLLPELRSQIQQLSILQLENLGEALLDFSSTRDLTDWLQMEVSGLGA